MYSAVKLMMDQRIKLFHMLMPLCMKPKILAEIKCVTIIIKTEIYVM